MRPLPQSTLSALILAICVILIAMHLGTAVVLHMQADLIQQATLVAMRHRLDLLGVVHCLWMGLHRRLTGTRTTQCRRVIAKSGSVAEVTRGIHETHGTLATPATRETHDHYLLDLRLVAPRLESLTVATQQCKGETTPGRRQRATRRMAMSVAVQCHLASTRVSLSATKTSGNAMSRWQSSTGSTANSLCLVTCCLLISAPRAQRRRLALEVVAGARCRIRRRSQQQRGMTSASLQTRARDLVQLLVPDPGLVLVLVLAHTPRASTAPSMKTTTKAQQTR